MAMLKFALLLSLTTACLADGGYSAPSSDPQAGYGAPTGGYQEPQAGYGTPSGGGYDAPQTGYGDYDQVSYQETDEGGDDIGAKLAELIPLFIAVFAAIILAQLLGPLLLQLLGLLVGILPMALNIKAPIINAILGPFGLSLCSIAAPASAAAPVVFPAGRSLEGRSLDGNSLKDFVSSGFGFDVSESKMNIIANLVNTGLESFSSQYDF